MASEHPGQGRRNRLLAALTSEDHSLLAPHFKELSLEVGSLLQEAGEPVEYVYFPHEGMVSLLAVMSDGQGIETATVGSEGVVGAMSGFRVRQGFTRAVVQAPLVASRMSTEQFHAALQKSESLRNLIASYNEVLLAQVQHWQMLEASRRAMTIAHRKTLCRRHIDRIKLLVEELMRKASLSDDDIRALIGIPKPAHDPWQARRSRHS